jgi:hypothetical protein
LAKPKFTLYKHIKIDGAWRCFRAAVASNNKVKPHLVVIDGEEQKHEGGSYCVPKWGTYLAGRFPISERGISRLSAQAAILVVQMFKHDPDGHRMPRSWSPLFSSFSALSWI